MKKTLLLTAGLFCLVIVSRAQVPKGTVFIGGSISLNSNTSTVSDTLNSYTQKTNSYSFSPTIGIVTKDNNVVGFSLSYVHQDNTGAPLNLYGGGFYLRRYVGLSKRLYFFYEENIFISYDSQEFYVDNAQTKRKNTEWRSAMSFYPGISYTVNDRFFLEAGISNLITISSSTTKSIDTQGDKVIRSTKNTQFSANYNFSSVVPFTIGFRIALHKQHRA